MASIWCRRCGLPVTVTGGSPMGRAVHSGTGEELGADGHLAAPITIDPAVSAAARRVEAKFGPGWRVTPTEQGPLRIESRDAGPWAMLPRVASSEAEACELLSGLATGDAR
jgi:hypothetical protein